jgi:hypothetical protein
MKGPALTTAAQVRRRLATDESGSSASADHSAELCVAVLDDYYEQTRDVLSATWRATRPRNEADDLVRDFEAAWVTLRAQLVVEHGLDACRGVPSVLPPKAEQRRAVPSLNARDGPSRPG